MNYFLLFQNSIRHNLSLHSRFVRVQNEGTGKSSWWMLNPDAKASERGKSSRRRPPSIEGGGGGGGPNGSGGGGGGPGSNGGRAANGDFKKRGRSKKGGGGGGGNAMRSVKVFAIILNCHRCMQPWTLHTPKTAVDIKAKH